MTRAEMDKIVNRVVHWIHVENARKAEILDELIDQAATYCAIQASNDGNTFAETVTSDVAHSLAVNVWFGVNRGEHRSCVGCWAEAEARLRNNECVRILIGGSE